MTVRLWERFQKLRDEVLNTAELGDRDRKGGEVFDAIVRALASRGETSPGIDLTLHDTLTQRLAWGDPEGVVLADADSVCKLVLEASAKAFSEPSEQIAVAEAVVEVGSVAARTIASAALGRAGRERAAQLREEVQQTRLSDAIKRQEAELDKLERALAEQTD